MSPFYRLGATVSEVWAKSNRETDAWMPLVQHCADTAEVARIYWNDHMAPSSRHVVERCLSESSNSGVAEGLAHRLAIFLAASHDIGKASPAFAVQVPALADRMIAGGLATRWPRPPSPRKPDNYGNSAACEMASLTEHGDRPFTDVAIAGGHIYLKVMKSFLEAFRDRGYIAPDAHVTEINAPIGIMRQQLGVWLARDAGGVDD